MAMDDNLGGRSSKTRIDFLQCLDTDVSIHIMSFLDDPVDVVRAGAVSRLWYQFVIGNGIAKKMCVKVFPELSKIVGIVIDDWYGTTSSALEKISAATKSENLDHTVYVSLLQMAKKSQVCQLLLDAISASSTDNFLNESVANTLHCRRFMTGRPLYWSSTGQSSPEVPETLLYKLKGDICVITDIDIQPFQARFQHGTPIYSAKSVRFRMGHPKSRKEMARELNKILPVEKRFDDKFVWTYTSPEFPMNQENVMQRFTLPEAALCLGGFLQIELLGRVQRHEKDKLFYICMRRVRVLGPSLVPTFRTKIKEASGEILLKYDPRFPCPITLEPYKMEHEEFSRMMRIPAELARALIADLNGNDDD